MADDATPTHDGESGTPAAPESTIRPAPEAGPTDYLDPMSPNHAFGRAMNTPGQWAQEQLEQAGERIADMTGWRPTAPPYLPPGTQPPQPADHPEPPAAPGGAGSSGSGGAVPGSDPDPGTGTIRPAPEAGLTDYLDPMSPNHAFGRAMNTPGQWAQEQLEQAGERIADMTGWRPTAPPYQPSPPTLQPLEPLQPAGPLSYPPLQPPEPPSFGPTDAPPEPLSYPPLQPPEPPSYPSPATDPGPGVGEMRPAPEAGVTDYLDPLSPNHAVGRALGAPGRWIDEQVEHAGERIADMTGWRPTPPPYEPSPPRSADGGIHLDGPGGSIDVGPGGGIHIDGPGGTIDLGGPGGSIDFGAGFGTGSPAGDLPATSDAIMDHTAGAGPGGPVDFGGPVDAPIDPSPMDTPTYAAPEPMDPPDYPPPEAMGAPPEPHRAPPEMTC